MAGGGGSRWIPSSQAGVDPPASRLSSTGAVAYLAGTHPLQTHALEVGVGIGYGGSHPVVADLDGDGRNEVVAVGVGNPSPGSSGSWLVTHADAPGDPVAPTYVGSSLPLGDVAVADLDADGHPDLIGIAIGLGAGEDGVVVRRGLPGGGYGSEIRAFTGPVGGLAVGRFDAGGPRTVGAWPARA